MSAMVKKAPRPMPAREGEIPRAEGGAKAKMWRPKKGGESPTLSKTRDGAPKQEIAKRGPPKPPPDLTEVMDQSLGFSRVLILDLQTAQADLNDPSKAGKARDIIARMWQARMGFDLSGRAGRRDVLFSALDAAADKSRKGTIRDRVGLFATMIAFRMPGAHVDLGIAKRLVEAYLFGRRGKKELLLSVARALDCDEDTIVSMAGNWRHQKVKEST
jgi:hypothetical protein